MHDRDDGDEHNDKGIGKGDAAHDPERLPGEGADHHHEHDAGQRRQRDLFNQEYKPYKHAFRPTADLPTAQ